MIRGQPYFAIDRWTGRTRTDTQLVGAVAAQPGSALARAVGARPIARTETQDAQANTATRSPGEGPGTGIANAAMQTAIMSGFAKQALDGARVGVKLREAYRARDYMPDGGRWGTGRLPTAIRQFVTMQPTTTIINPAAPDVRGLDDAARQAALIGSKGQTFTRLDRSAYISSTLLGAGLAVVTLASGAPNLVSGVMQDGPLGLVQTREGRAGLNQFVGGGLALWLLASGMREVSADVALQRNARLAAKASRVATGMKPTVYDRLPTAIRFGFEGLHHVAAGARSPRNALPWTAAVGLGSAALLWVNRWGYLDGLNSNDNRGFGTRLRDALDATPVLGTLVD